MPQRPWYVKDRCVGSDWKCGLEIKAEVGTKHTNWRWELKLWGRDKGAKERNSE